MPQDAPRRAIRESLEGFYVDGGAQFWRIFNETPRAAMAAFRQQPEVFGTLQSPYANWMKARAREHARISELMAAWQAAWVDGEFAEAGEG